MAQLVKHLSCKSKNLNLGHQHHYKSQTNICFPSNGGIEKANPWRSLASHPVQVQQGTLF